MIRASLGNQEYWDRWTKFGESTITQDLEHISKPSGNPVYRPQFVFDLSQAYPRQIITRYSRGDSITELSPYFVGLLDAWELSNRLAEEVCKEHHLKTCRDWTFELGNLNHYNWCFWLVGLALTLDISDEQWSRLVALIGAGGQDELLDRVMATRQKDRFIGTQLLHRKPYARLLKAIDALPEHRPLLLLEFLDNWYPELARKGNEELWWYVYGDPVKNPLDRGSYFGRWCIEAAAVAKVFNVDDTLCLGHQHYPGDLLRPNGPSTHANRVVSKPGVFKMLFGGGRGK
jgi:hypothetical protein